MLLGGTSMNVNLYKFQVIGNSYLNGNLVLSGYLEISDSDNSHYARLYPSNDVNVDITLPNITDTLVGRNTTDTLTDKTFNDLTGFTNSLSVKYLDDNTVSGYVKFFDKDNSNTIDLHIENHTVSSNINVFLPNSVDNTVLVGRNTSDTLTNKTITSFTGNSSSTVTTPSTTGTIALTSDLTNFITASSQDTLTNKTLISPTITGTGSISGVFTGNLTGNADTSTKIASITNSNIVQLTSIQTLTNKTITQFTGNSSAVITTPSSTGTLLTNQDTIPVNKGGTNITSYAVGDILYASATGTLSKLAKGSANTFLMSNGTTPFYSAGYSFQNPISVSGTNVGLEGLSGFGSENQIISTNGSSVLQYRTLSAGTNVTIANTASSITISSSENYWERDSNVSSFDIKTTNTVDTIALTVPLSTTSTFVSTSSIKSTLGLISGGGEYLKFIDYSGTKPLELKGIINTSAQRTYHLAFKHDSTGTSYPLLGQDINGNLLFHWNALGDRFTFKSNGDSEFVGNISALTSSNITTQTGDFGNDHSKFNYDGSTYTWLYDPSGTNGATGFAGSYMGWHNNGSAIYLNTPAAGTSAGDYIGFATGNVPKGRMSMDGNFKITGSVTTSHTFCDERVKENIQDYNTNAVELLNKLKIKSFNRKTFDNLKSDDNGILLPFTERFSDKTYYDIGLIAQEVLKIPELEFLIENQDGGDIEPMTIPDWNPLVAICIKSIQELSAIVEKQQNQIDHMMTVIDKLTCSSSFKEFKS